MRNEAVLFVGGNPGKYSSVQIRCEDIATRLGCDRVFSASEALEVADNYSAFVCVKTNLTQPEIMKLSKKGPVIWDIIDKIPPRYGVTWYLASTENVKRKFRNFGAVKLIPHHHCNFSSVPNSDSRRNVSWIGTMTWYPNFSTIKHCVFDVRNMKPNDVISAYRQTGIGLNFRAKRNRFRFHVAINSGIKLINCVGFGIPSISDIEPAYLEIEKGCTIFSAFNELQYWVKKLQDDEKLYERMREQCVAIAPKFHISKILENYQELIEAL